MNSIENILKRLRESRINEEGVYSPYDHSSRDNSAEIDAMKSEETSHPYVGNVVKCLKTGKQYPVTGAYDTRDGVCVRCQTDNIDITMRPDEYRIIKEAVDSDWEYWEMPDNYGGPWTHPQYTRRYDNTFIGFIYPPFQSDRPLLRDYSHNDYIASIYDDAKAEDVSTEEHFDDLEAAKDWVDNKVQELMQDGVNESSGDPGDPDYAPYPDDLPKAFWRLYDKYEGKVWYSKSQFIEDIESLGYEIGDYADTAMAINPKGSRNYIIMSVIKSHPTRYELDFEQFRKINNESYTVIDNTDTKNSGDSEKYKVNTKEEAEQRKQELIDQGSDEDKITIK